MIEFKKHNIDVITIAKYCKVSKQAVYQWIREGVPAKRCKQIEELTDGKITRINLRPDIFS